MVSIPSRVVGRRMAKLVPNIYARARLQKNLDASFMAISCGMDEWRPFVVAVRSVPASLEKKKLADVGMPFPGREVHGILAIAVRHTCCTVLEQ